MEVNMIDGISLENYSQLYKDNSITQDKQYDSFDDVLSAIMNSVEETNTLQNKAEEQFVRELKKQEMNYYPEVIVNF